MAKVKVEYDGLDAFISGMQAFADNVDSDVDEILDQAAPDVVTALKSNIASVANRTDDKGRPYSTGALAASIEPTQAKMNAYGHFVAVRPTGKDKKGTRNGEKLAYLEYGTSKQAARPVIAKTVSQTQGKVTENITRAFEEKTNGYLA